MHDCSDDSVICDWRFDAAAHFDRNGAIYSGVGGGGEDGTETGAGGEKGREEAKRCETKRLRCGREKIAQACLLNEDSRAIIDTRLVFLYMLFLDIVSIYSLFTVAQTKFHCEEVLQIVSSNCLPVSHPPCLAFRNGDGMHVHMRCGMTMGWMGGRH